jgi:hypothetical protein
MANETELRRAIEEALHALVSVGGEVATDRPDLFNFDEHPNALPIDNKAAMRMIERAIRAIDRALGQDTTVQGLL